MLACTLAVLGPPPAGAQSPNYRVEIRPELNGLDVRIEPVASSGMLVVNLTNNSAVRVRCTLNFDAAPQTPQRSTRNLNPGQRGSSVLRAQRRWFSVTVGVACTPAAK